ncbi:MAG TPA: sigma-54 dependent transcriptional regulator [Longimicrobium sp.]
MSRNLLVVDDDPAVRSTFEFHLGRSGCAVASAESAEQALGMVHGFCPEIVITDVQMGEMSGLELLRRLHSLRPDIDVVVITGHEDMESAIGAMREGAYDYLVKPLELQQLDAVLERCFRDRALRRRLPPDDASAGGLSRQAVGRSPEMIEIFKLIGRLAGTRTPVLIRGETGTGKELVARAIHDHSPWAAEPFVAINCTAVAESLLESELFGHVKGSFTGAVADRRGRFELAESGTVFLDEIGDTSVAFQAKLLRVLQEGEFYPVGAERPRVTRARVVAATHRPVEELIGRGAFREDLYFRLRVVEIRIPPLRERRTDIPLLAQHLLARAAAELRKEVRVVPPAVMELLRAHDWPGNVRELENAMMRAVVLAQGPALRVEDFALAGPPAGGAAPGDAGSDSLDDVERSHVMRILSRSGGNKSQAARVLAISRPRLDRILTRAEGELTGK